MSFITNYKDINRRSTLRDIGRNLVLDGLVLKEKLQKEATKFLSKPRVQFVYIHHVFEDEEAAFRRLIERLLENHNAISYSDAVEKILSNNIDKPYIVFSSDDGFKNNVRAAKILNEFRISACFFINPGIIGEENFEKVKRFCSKNLHFPPIEFMNWNDVHDLMKDGHEIGSHTMQHINIGELSYEKVTADLIESYNTIQKYCGKAEHFAYPYGRYFHFNEKVKRAVFDIGFTSCASAERGCHVNHTSRLEKEDLFIRRDHVVLHWKLDHVLHFLINNSRNASEIKNLSPYNSL